MRHTSAQCRFARSRSASLCHALPRSASLCLALALARSASLALALPRSASLALAQAARPARVSQASVAAGETEEGQDEETAIAIAEGVDLEPKLTLELVDCVLLFESFPEKSHTGLNIENWLLNGLNEAGLEKADIALTVPDGAANGLRALRAMGLPYEICDPHQLQVGQPACAPAAYPRTHARTHTHTCVFTTNQTMTLSRLLARSSARSLVCSLSRLLALSSARSLV